MTFDIHDWRVTLTKFSPSHQTAFPFSGTFLLPLKSYVGIVQFYRVVKSGTIRVSEINHTFLPNVKKTSFTFTVIKHQEANQAGFTVTTGVLFPARQSKAITSSSCSNTEQPQDLLLNPSPSHQKRRLHLSLFDQGRSLESSRVALAFTHCIAIAIKLKKSNNTKAC